MDTSPKCPFIVPFVRYGRVIGNFGARIETMTDDRVAGHITSINGTEKAFNVKHDGNKFTVGFDGSKITYQFRNVGRAP
jgi:hypothetical protein